MTLGPKDEGPASGRAPASETRSLKGRWGLRTLGVAVFFIAVLITAVAYFLVDHQSQDDYAVLQSRGVAGAATVTRSEPNNHNLIYFSYKVDSRVYDSSGRAEAPNPSAAHLQPGDSVQIVYDPANPRIVCACNPSQMRAPLGQFPNALLLALLAVGSAVPLIVLVLRRR